MAELVRTSVKRPQATRGLMEASSRGNKGDSKHIASPCFAAWSATQRLSPPKTAPDRQQEGSGPKAEEGSGPSRPCRERGSSPCSSSVTPERPQ